MAETSFDLDAVDESLIQEVVDINPDINPNDAPAPVDDGTYRVKFDQNFTYDYKETNNDAKTPFVTFKFSGTILAEGTRATNRKFFFQENTLVFDGKNQLAYVIRMALGDTAEARQYVKGLTNYVLLAKAFKQILASEPTIRVSSKWVASRKIEGGGKNGRDKYEVVKSGQKNFPPDGNGGFKHVINDPKTGTEVAARAEVQDFFPDNAQ